MRILVVGAAILMASCGSPSVEAPAALAAASTPSPTDAPSPTPTPTSTPVPSAALVAAAPSAAAGLGGSVPSVVLGAGVVARVAELIRTSGGSAGIVFADGTSGETLHEVAADEVVFAASLYKLGVLLEAERRIELGTLRAAQVITITKADQRDGGSYTPTGTKLTIEQALERMITVSDNASGLALLRLLGTEPIHETLAREGIKGQYFTSQGSVTTARAVATFFGELARGALVSAAASARMLARLSRQRVVDRIPAALPAGAVLGNKTGNLGFVTHDAGLIKGPDGKPVVLVVLTWGSSEEKGAQLIRDVAAAVYAGLARP